MLTKILFTVAVIAGVLIFYRAKNSVANNRQKTTKTRDSTPNPGTLAYVFVALVLVVSSVFYYFHWAEQHTLLIVQVTHGEESEAHSYQVYRKDMQGKREFITIDGRKITLGNNDRIEVTEKD